MNRFLRNTLFISLLFAGVYVAMALLVGFAVRRASFALEPSQNILVLGHSMGECAIDPTVIPRVANYCQSAEHYMYSYLKLNYFLRDNPQIDTVLLTFAPFAFVNGADEGILKGDFATQKAKLFYPLMGSAELRLLAMEGLLLTNLSPRGYVACRIKNRKYYNELGGFIALERDKLQKDIELRASEPAKAPSPYGDSLQRLYLNKIISLCKEKGVTLIFIQTPIYRYDTYYPRNESDSIRKVCFSDIPFWDFKDLPLADSMYGDITHLNYKGAKAFSRILADSLLRQKIN